MKCPSARRRKFRRINLRSADCGRRLQPRGGTDGRTQAPPDGWCATSPATSASTEEARHGAVERKLSACGSSGTCIRPADHCGTRRIAPRSRSSCRPETPPRERQYWLEPPSAEARAARASAGRWSALGAGQGLNVQEAIFVGIGGKRRRALGEGDRSGGRQDGAGKQDGSDHSETPGLTWFIMRRRSAD